MAVCDSSNSTYQELLTLIADNENHFLTDESEGGQRLHGGLGALKDGLVQITSEFKFSKAICIV